ncbi:MAG TPA: hypothetical protein VGZ22_08185 [Isosphaeraceae bacterium]|jgi:hypothetical protein|nr:hypothetical protein [Isosphaeraceae bacterium]
MTSEHRIRLRGGWEREAEGQVTKERQRVTLPADWPTDARSGFRLIRRFSAPPLDSIGEAVSLRLGSVPGLRRVWLNDRLIASPAAGTDSLEIDLSDALSERNMLVLEVDPAVWCDRGGKAEVWGLIALVIRSRP